MKKPLNAILCLSFATLLFSSSSASAWQTSAPVAPTRTATNEQDIKALASLLQACDDSLETSKAVTANKDLLINSQANALLALDERLKKERSTSSGILSNTTLWFVAGMLTAGFTVYLTKP